MSARLFAPVLFALGLFDLGVLNLRLVPDLAARRAAEARAAAVAAAPAASPRAAPTPTHAEPTPIVPAASVAPAHEPTAAMADILFEIDYARINDAAARTELRRIASELREKPARRLLIRGHADRMGSASHNLVLSHRRAMIVLLVLMEHAAPLDRISIEAVGADEPRDPENTPFAWAKNRRVQVLWR